MPATEARDAVLTALRIAGVDLASGGRTALPTARTRSTIDQLCDTTPERLRDDRVDVRELVRGALDWDRPRATKAVTRTAGKAMLATRDDGASLWANAVEALSYVSVWSPLLEPDRLDRVLMHAVENPGTIYAPIRYVAGPAGALRRVVGHYQAARLETLAVDLWDCAHDGRWWDICGGLGVGADGTVRRRRRRRRQSPEEAEAEMAARTRVITQATDGPTAAVRDLVTGVTTHWNAGIGEKLRDARLSGGALDEVVEFSKLGHDDPDVDVLLAMLVDLPIENRPANPIPAMIDALEFMLDDTDPREHLPKKPDKWGLLYPEGSLRPYPTPDEILVWNNAVLPNCAGAVIEVIRSPHELFENRDYMGNCTGGYNQRCLNGTWVLGKIHYDNQLYNWSTTRDGGGWRLGEVNSRFNRGAVPNEVRNGLAALITNFNGRIRPVKN